MNSEHWLRQSRGLWVWQRLVNLTNSLVVPNPVILESFKQRFQAQNAKKRVYIIWFNSLIQGKF